MTLQSIQTPFAIHVNNIPEIRHPDAEGSPTGVQASPPWSKRMGQHIISCHGLRGALFLHIGNLCHSHSTRFPIKGLLYILPLERYKRAISTARISSAQTSPALFLIQLSRQSNMPLENGRYTIVNPAFGKVVGVPPNKAAIRPLIVIGSIGKIQPPVVGYSSFARNTCSLWSSSSSSVVGNRALGAWRCTA